MESNTPVNTAPSNGRGPDNLLSLREERLLERAETFSSFIEELDLGMAEYYEIDFTEMYVGDIAEVDRFSAKNRHSDYTNCTPLRSTALFAQQYRSFWGNNSSCPVKESFGENEICVIKHVWRARQTADALGMEYWEYLCSIFEAYAQHGQNFMPLPHELHGPLALTLVMGSKVNDAEGDLVVEVEVES